MKLLTSFIPCLFLSGAALAENLTPGVYWNVHGGQITRLQSTYTIPPNSHVGANNTAQGFWMGLAPANALVLFQNVIANYGNTTGDWNIRPEYCCQPNIFLQATQEVKPGQIVVNDIVQQADGVWLDTWTVYNINGQPLFGTTVTLDLSLYPAAPSPFQLALFIVELDNAAQWDFGPVTFSDIRIEANTSSTTWCNNPVVKDHTSSWDIATPVASSQGSGSVCCVSHIALMGL